MTNNYPLFKDEPQTIVNITEKFLLSKKKNLTQNFYTFKKFNNFSNCYKATSHRFKNKQQVLIFNDTNTIVATLIIKFPLITVFEHTENGQEPKIMIKIEKKSYQPYTSAILSITPHTSDSLVKKFGVYPTELFMTNPNIILNNLPTIKKHCFCLQFQQQNIIPSRKNIQFTEDDLAVLELGKLSRNQFSVISSRFNPVLTFAFAVSWLTFL